MQRLILRFGSDLNAPLQWLVFNDDEQEIIASGELSTALELASLKERAQSAEVIALAPASEILLTSVTLPPNAGRKILNAIPFMLEEEICGDISQHFVALGKREGEKQQVAVVAKTKLDMWQHAMNDADIFCQTLIPDALTLPVKENAYSLLQINDQLIARFDEHSAQEGEIDWLLPMVLQKAKNAEVSLDCYSELTGIDSTSEELTFHYDDLPLQLMLKNIQASSINLLQGPYAVKRAGNPHWQKWKLAAALAAIALTVNLVSKTIELNQIKSERAELNQQIAASIAEGFPNIGQYRQARIAVQNEMKRLEQGGGGLSMLAILSQLTDAFSNSGVTPQTLRFDASRTELRMQSVATNFESLERFRRDIQSLGFEVDQGAINNQGDKVVGVVIVRG
ncbi:type II secretion system protein GspL [Glaciecola siphonariae]|uniref:Type II secretion system protein L n=1 Tax=Glaciecola siphonariae TaxID=521012 RepID=A0ABV9LR11_9ALTE